MSTTVPPTASKPMPNGVHISESHPSGFELSKSVQSAAIPAIPVARRWIEQYTSGPRQTKPPMIDVSQGVPGTAPPPVLLEALAEQASAPGAAKYGPIAGEPVLRQLLAGRMRKQYARERANLEVEEDVDVRPDDIALSAGANLAFVAVIMSICDPGEEVIIPVPWYFNQEQVLVMRGVRPVPLRTRPEEAFLPRVADAEALITGRTKAIALVSPNNPTGAIYPPSLLAHFALLCQKHHLALILDETYRDFLPSSPHTLFSPSSSPTLLASFEPVLSTLPAPEAEDLRKEAKRWDWRKTLVSLYSFSKAYAVPGHRLGAVVCGREVGEQVEKVLDCLQICPPRAIQLALASQFPHLDSFVSSQRATLTARHVALRESLPPRWKLAAQGGFFAYIRHPFPSRSSFSVCERLALELGVACLPGTFFQPGEEHEFWGGVEEARKEDRWFRVGVANVEEGRLREAGERLRWAEERWGWGLEG